MIAVTCIAGSPHVCSRIVPKSINVAERQGLARLVSSLRQAEALRLLQQQLFKQAVLGTVGFAEKYMRGDVLPSHLQTTNDIVSDASCRELTQCTRWGHAVCRTHKPKQLQANLQQSNVLLHALPSALPQMLPAQILGR